VTVPFPQPSSPIDNFLQTRHVLSADCPARLGFCVVFIGWLFPASIFWCLMPPSEFLARFFPSQCIVFPLLVLPGRLSVVSSLSDPLRFFPAFLVYLSAK